MIRELYQVTEKSVAFNITQSRIDSVRTKSVTKSGCRVYDSGCIGVAGTMGEPDEAAWAQAEKNLAFRVPYAFAPETGKRTRDLREGAFSQEEFLDKAEALLEKLRTRFPNYVFSNKLLCEESEVLMQNDLGLQLRNIDRMYNFAVIVRAKESVSIFDTFMGGNYRTFDEKALLDDISQQLCVFRKPVQLPEGDKQTVVIMASDMLAKFAEALNGKLLGHGSSIFAGKMGTAQFDGRFSLALDNSAEAGFRCFFDAEGVQLPGDRLYLIENGVLKCGYADKFTADRFAGMATGCAGGEYDDAPSLGSPSLTIDPSGQTLAELTQGERCLLIAVSSGGDWSNDGTLALPVQLAFLLEDGKLIGKLPEFSVGGGIYDLFGVDFAGLTQDRPWMNERYLVTKMKIVR